MTLTKLALSVIWVLMNLASHPLPGMAQSATLVNPISSLLIKQNQEENTDFSGEGRPGHRTGGGSRSSCPDQDIPLTALIPVTNWAKTVSAHPTLWFYIPYSAEQVPVGEFVLQEEDGNDIYRTGFRLPQTPGFISVSLEPKQPPLKINQWYRWYFKLYCGQDESSPPIFVEGWVQRVELTPALEHHLQQAKSREYTVYAENLIWYDAIDNLAKLRLIHPSNDTFNQDWNNLFKLAEFDLEQIPEAPIVGSIITGV